jgi:taurine dioxygenase
MAQAAVQETRPYTRFETRPMCGALGAEVIGLDLSKPIDDTLKAELRRAFLDNLVLVVRNQKLTERQQIDFTAVFGTVEPHPLYKSRLMEGYPEILVLEHVAGQWFNGRNDIWHTDLTFKPTPPMMGLLYCRAVQEGFGDTMFANMIKAYEFLSPGFRAQIDGLKAEHSAALLRQRNNKNSYNVPIDDIPEAVIHPVVRTHPETKKKALFVNPSFTTNFVGMTREESLPILERLFAAQQKPEFTYRHRWRINDVVLWDQRVTQHYVINDYGPEMHRRMHRTTAAGDRPF